MVCSNYSLEALYDRRRYVIVVDLYVSVYLSCVSLSVFLSICRSLYIDWRDRQQTRQKEEGTANRLTKRSYDTSEVRTHAGFPVEMWTRAEGHIHSILAGWDFCGYGRCLNLPP